MAQRKSRTPVARRPPRTRKSESSVNTLQATITRSLSVARAKYDALIGTMTSADLREKDGWIRYYESVGTILRDNLWIAADFKTAQRWVEHQLRLPMRTVWRYVRVAEHATPKELRTYGTAKLDLLIQLRDAQEQQKAKRGSKPSRTTRALNPSSFSAKVVRNGKPVTVDLSQITAVELSQAIAALRASTEKTSTPLAAQLRQALDAKGHSTVQIKERNGSLVLSAIAIDQLSAVAKIVAAIKREGKPRA